MKIAGSATLHAPADRVWAALNDPAVLARTIPGCQRLEALGPDSWTMTVAAGVASIKGLYKGEVALHDQQPPGSFRLRASGAGAPGTVRADVLVRLADGPDGTTHLQYDADAVVGGMVGGVGQRMLTGVAKKTAGEFFSAVDAVLTSGSDAGSPAQDAAAPAATGGADAAPLSAQSATSPSATSPSATSPAAGSPAVLLPAAPAPAGAPAAAADVGRSPFLQGAVVGAAAALLGVLVGARVARRP